MNWNLLCREVDWILPGDEILGDAAGMTSAITIDTTVADV
jgi:hypothetical protein